MARLAIILGLAAAVLAGAACSEPQPPSPNVLDRPIDLDLRRTTVAAALDRISAQVPNLVIGVDQGPGSVPDMMDWPLSSIRARGITVREALDVVLPSKLAWQAAGNRVRIAHGQVLRDEVAARTHPVPARILQHIEAEVREYEAQANAFSDCFPENAWQWLARQWRQVGAPDPHSCEEDVWAETVGGLRHAINGFEYPGLALWKADGGPGDIQRSGNSLTVTQTPRGHERVAALLALLDEALRTGAEGKSAAFLAPVQPSAGCAEDPSLAQTNRLLDRPVDVDFKDVALEKGIEYLAEVSGANVVLDPGLACTGLNPREPLTLQLRAVPLRDVLDLALGPALAYVARPHHVLVTTRERAEQRLPTVAYPVADLVAALNPPPPAPPEEGGLFGDLFEPSYGSCNWQELADAIQYTVNSAIDRHVAAWADEGGWASIDYLFDALVVRQTPRGHQRVAELLTALRRAATAPAGQDLAAWAPAPADPPAVARTLQHLRKAVTAHLHDAPLDAAMASLAAQCPDVDFVAYPMRPVGWSREPQPRITVHAGNLPAEEVLAHMAAKSVCWTVGPGYVLLEPEGRTGILPLTYPVAYPLDDLVAAVAGALSQPQQAEGSTSSQSPAGAAKDLIAKTVGQAICPEADGRPPYRDMAGEPALCRWLGNFLVVVLTRRGHEETVRVLESLRRDPSGRGLKKNT
jgi:hypothetical protein